MTDAPDATLLEQFAQSESEEAFTELVRRHIGLVHSVAARCTNNSPHAQEITQAVFIVLARKAPSLSRKIVLSGWLYHTARLMAANFQRAEFRRIRREQEVFMQAAPNDADIESAWQELGPLLEDAMAGLGSKDRDAIVLRFFENKSLREVGTAMGLEERAAQKRVARGLEKLRAIFTKRGVTFSAAIIASAVAANSVQATPVELATAVAAATAKGTAVPASTLTLVKGALKVMAWTKAKIAIAFGVGAILAGTTATIAVQMANGTRFVRIEGTSQVELYSNPPRIVATAKIVILTDGKSYRISIVSKGGGTLTNDAYDMQADYGCDGTDIFVLSNETSPVHQTHEGLGGFAFPGRFPAERLHFVPKMVQAAWLAYCSKDYFNISSNHTGLRLGNQFSTIWPDFVTNQVNYWPTSTLPQTITGWSRNWIMASRTNSIQPLQALELKQYPDGFKAWKFTATDPVLVGNRTVPRQFALETFSPKADTATSGDDTRLIGKTTFVADSITVGEGKFEPLPPVTVPDLQVMDMRFEDVAASYVVTSHAGPEGWPTRGSKGFKQVAAEASKLARENPNFVKAELKKRAQVIVPP